jgi:hypothetical protein
MHTRTRRRLSFEQAQAIRRVKEANPRLTQPELAARFSTTQATVSRVLAGQIFAQPPKRKLTEEQVQEVRLAGVGDPWDREQVMRKYGLTTSEVSSIVKGRTYGDVPLSDREIDRKLLLKRLSTDLAAFIEAITVDTSAKHEPPGSR